MPGEPALLERGGRLFVRAEDGRLLPAIAGGTEIWQRYTAVVSGQTVTLTPKAANPAQPDHLGMSTIVLTTVANPAPAEYWKSYSVDGSEYEVRIFRMTKS
jgi:hypothetical protein